MRVRRLPRWLDDLGPYLLFGTNPGYQPILDEMRDVLEAAGEEVPIVAVNETTGDETATAAYLDEQDVEEICRAITRVVAA